MKRLTVPRLAVSTVVLIGLALLHAVLFLLWPDRAVLEQGLLRVFNTTNVGFDLGSFLLLPWIALFLVGLAARLLETHPGIFDSLRWTSDSPLASLFRILGFYLVAAGVGILLKYTLTFHFVPSLGLFCLATVLVTGAIFAGRRRPFMDISLSRPREASRRRRADGVSLVLLVALYAEFTVDKAFWHLNDDMPNWAWQGIMVVLAGLGVLLGWSLLHGSLVTSAGRLVRWLETQARLETSEKRTTWAVHLAAAVASLLLLKTCYLLWTSKSWFLPREDGSTVFLGIDWYFVTAQKSVPAGEVFVILVFGVVGSILLWRTVPESTSA